MDSRMRGRDKRAKPLTDLVVNSFHHVGDSLFLFIRQSMDTFRPLLPTVPAATAGVEKAAAGEQKIGAGSAWDEP